MSKATQKDVRKLYEVVLETTSTDLRQLRFAGGWVHFIEYQAYEPRSPFIRNFNSLPEAAEWLQGTLDLCEAMAM